MNEIIIFKFNRKCVHYRVPLYVCIPDNIINYRLNATLNLYTSFIELMITAYNNLSRIILRINATICVFNECAFPFHNNSDN